MDAAAIAIRRSTLAGGQGAAPGERGAGGGGASQQLSFSVFFKIREEEGRGTEGTRLWL